MTEPQYPNQPTDAYLTDELPNGRYDWNPAPGQALQPTQYQPQPPVQYQPQPVNNEQLERQQVRRAATLRMSIALFAAIPITAIMAGMFAGYTPYAQFAGVFLGWIGMCAVIWLSLGGGQRR